MADGLLNKASIILTPTGYKAGTLYNVAPVVEPYEDFDFARASVASRVNSSGLVEMVGRTLSSELVVNGDFATDSDWNKGTGWSINAGEAILTNGGGSLSKSDGIFVVGKTYKFSIEITSISLGAFSPKTNTGQNIFSSVTLNTVGVHTSTFTVTSGVNLQIRASGTTTGSIDNVSVKEIIDTNNIPRISYDSNGDNGHILLEPTSTNLFPYSEDFSQWLIFNTINRTSNYGTSPDGTQNSYEIGSSGGAADFIYLILTITASQSHTLSFFIKNVDSTQSKFWNASESTININWSGSTITSIDSGANYEAYGNGWYKITSTATSNSDGEFIARFYPSTSGTASVELYGYQLESLPYATSYIPTLTGSTETRATETATGAGSATLINSTEGVLYAEIAAFEVQPDFFISMNDGTNNNRVIIKFSDAIDNQLTAFTINSTNASSITHTISNFKQYNKIALSYNSSYLKLFVNGQEVGTSVASPNLPVGLNVLNLSNLLTDKNVKGKLKSLAVFNEALSDDELNNLTG